MVVPDNNKDELDPISFWVLLLLSGGQKFTFHELVKSMNQSKESVWEALRILQQKKYVKNDGSMFVINFEGAVYLTQRGILASEAEDTPKSRDFQNKFKPHFFSSWIDLLIRLAVPLILLIPTIILASYLISGYTHISLDKSIYQYGVWLVYFGFVALYLKFSYHYIKETERLVIFRGKKAICKKGPGLVFTLPLVDHPTIVDMREKSLEIKKEPCLTSDNILVNAGYYMTWQVEDPIASLTKVSKIEDSMSLLCASALRTSIAQFTMEDALARQPALNTQICARIEHKAGDWGVKVNSTELRELTPPETFLRFIENRFKITLESEAALARSNVKAQALRQFLTIGEGMARNPIAQELAYLDSLEKVNNIISGDTTQSQKQQGIVKEFLKTNPDFDLLHLEIMAPSLMPVRELLEKKIKVLDSLDLIYSIFAILHAGKQDSLSELADLMQKFYSEGVSSEFKSESIYPLLYSNQIEPLMVASSSYGSPLAEDVLGIGSAITQLKEIIKDISYRGKFEKEQSRITLEKLNLENKQAAVTLERMEIENKQAMLALEKSELENKQKKIEIIDQQLILYEKIKKKKIPKTERDYIIKSLLVPTVRIAESEINPKSITTQMDKTNLLSESINT